MDPFLHKLRIELPIIQAPMAGVSNPEMAAAVSNAGGLGSIGVGPSDAENRRCQPNKGLRTSNLNRIPGAQPYSRDDFQRRDFVPFEFKEESKIHWTAGKVTREPAGDDNFAVLLLARERLAGVLILG